jgi:hypothetical protein
MHQNATPQITVSPDHSSPLDAATLSRIYDRKASELFVILDKQRTTCLVDPGTRKPYCTPSVKMAENVAREYNGIVSTLSDAIKTLYNQSAN